ncbi:hypothetical protein DSL72_003003 [Monilinia vaccinii-corymbosi]|uniref:Carrier domain-containing protein n=1 Tax=Monilinia vaccinii-corymbosi TaxID=61207 RepID=A0A8A3P003_9HELO|nr:hypothetical protein DSL72_003003 [Monilinia vaccinii-corymbosi]
MDIKISSLNDPPRFLSGPQLLHDLIRWDKQENSCAIDFTSHGKREKYLYKDIQACVASLVTRIKSTLRRNQIPQEQQHIVPILLPQSPGLYISQLAILQSGGAFCPINLDAPKERIRFVAGDISASIIITTSEFQESVSWQDGPSIIIVDEFPVIPTLLEDISESRVPENNDLAYVMYTSGSSGTPKGVAVSHLAASQSLLAHESLIPKFERFLQFAAPSFDVSVFEIFFPLTRGQTLVGCDRSQLLNDLPGMINELDIDAVELTPTVVGALLQKRAYVPKLKLLMTIGEMLTRPIVEEFGGSMTKDSLLYGMYGPTEAAIHCTIHPKMEANAKPGNIGVPFDTVSAFIAEAASGPGNEQDLRFLPQGELGELILGGPQLANGYLNREEQNKAAFVTMGDKSYYRTGDKGRILADGSIEIHGRMSGGQVKLRGQRVELGEVEDAVYKHGGIKTVVAVVLSGVLIVFALTDDDTMNSDQVLRTCSQWLPNFMVPSEIVLLPEFPYLPSGKVDKRRLEANYQQQREGEEDLTNLTQTEVTVREVLRDVLGSFTSNIRLAAAGLDSLASIRVSRELRLRGLNITTLAVLQAETLSSLVKLCQSCPETPNSTTMKVAISNSDPHAMLNGDANNIEISYPCTPLQNAMLTETALDQRAYRNWVELDLPGITNIDYLRTNLHKLAHHNPILRTGFAASSDNSGYMQFIWKSFPDSHIENVDAFARDLDISNNASLHHPICFKILSTKPCLKLLIHIHHALYDAWSLDLILDDLDCLLREETPISRPQFTEVVSGYLNGRLSSDSQVSKDYWKDYMAHLELRCMPNFHPRKVSSAGLAVAHHLTELSTLDVEFAAKRMVSSPQAILQAAYALILASYLGSTDVCFGTVFSGRTLPIAGIEDIIGPCLATLPIRIDISTASTLQDLVEELNSTNRKHLEYSTVPLREIKSVNGFEPRQQLFDTLLIWQQTLHSYDHSRKNVLLVNQTDQLEFNLTLEITPTSNTIHFKANYQQSVFPESQIDMLLRQLEATTKAIIEHAENSPKNAFNQCSPGILSFENPTPSLRFGPETLISPVERMAKEDPDRSAIAFASKIDDGNSVVQYLSYGALNNRANQLGHYLSYHGVLQDDIICICLEKSHDFYASILATAKVGAGYLPVTPDTPRDRLQHILHEANVKILIGSSVSRPILENFAEQDIIYIDEIDLSHQSTENFTSIFKPEHISYCVFTSGSTGTPKGVLVTQGNLLSNLDVLVEIYPASRDSKLLQSCSQAFDVSVFEIFFTWKIGGCLCSAVKDVLFRDIELAIRVLGVTHLSLTPTVAALIDPQKVPKVKFLVTAGEAVTQKVFNTWAGRGLYQGYGPSETTNICTVKPRVTLDDRIDNIGLPFTNTSTFVLARDKEFSLVPRGGEGEFCFGGSQVFRGYINRAQQEGRIIDHPKYGRLYKSGDFGRLMPDGSLVFTGRKDDQVKIRGQRVELGEINNLLISLPDVDDCVTMVINGKGNSQCLVCFFIPEPNASESMLPLSVDPIMISSLYQALESKLPSYMVPSNLIPVSTLPSTSQGKIDKRRLISLYESFELQYLDSTTRASKPSIDHQWTELELSIRSILGEISQSPVEDIGPDASFFSYGIDSISAIAFSRKLRQVIMKQINISDILNHSTVVRLAGHLSKCQEIEEGDMSLVDDNFNIPGEFIESTISHFSKMGRTAEKVTACTPLQEAMLSAGEFSLGASYSNHTIFNIFGDLERLQGCWQEMVERHEILRTCFVSTDMQNYPYVQVVLKNFEVEFGHLDSSTLEDAVVELERLSTDNKNTPPYSIKTLQADGEQRLLLSMHHALYDGVALSILYDEVEKLYHGLPLPIKVSFTPFLQHMSSMDIQSSDKFWEYTLQGYQQLHLEDISDKPNQIQNNSTRVQQLVAKTPLSQIEKNIKKHSTTPLAVFHAAWAATMSELLKTTDICFGNVVSGRTVPVDGIERLVAPCFNTIPTRLVDIHKSTYLEAFRKLQNANANSLPFQFTPLRRLQSKFSPDGSRLFDTLFILQQPSKDLDSSIWSIVEDNGAMDFPLVCEIIPKPNNDTLEIAFHSSTSIFSDKDAHDLIQKFENILETALKNPRRQIMSSFVRAQITTKSEPRERNKRDGAGAEGQNKVMNRLESEIRDVIAGFTDIPLQKIGRDTSIFRLGLDSISTVQVASRLRSQGHNLLASDVLQHPTIARVASYLENNIASKSEEKSQFDFVAFYQKYCEGICSKLAIQYENIEAIRPCTAVQQGMLAQSLHSDGHEYINSMSLELLKSHSIAEVRDAWIKVCKAHEMLRTIFAQTEDPTYPFVMVTFKKDSFAIPWFESREQAPLKGIDRLVNPWDMTVNQKDNKTLLIFTAHHALYDAQSMQMIFSDFTKLYHFQAVASRPSINTLLSSVLQASKGAQDEKRAFWQRPENRIVVNKFPDLTPLRVTALSNAVRELKSQASLKELEDRCRDLGVTMQAAGQATWARLLMAYTGENVTTFGMTLSGRSVCDDANMVAFPTIVTLPWSGYPEGRIFDTLFAYQKLPDDDNDDDMMSPPWKAVDEEASVDYVVSLEVQPTQSGEITIRLSFREEIVPTEHAELIVKQFDALLLDTLNNPNHPCSVAPEVEMDLLSITPAQDPVLPDSVTLLHQYVERGAKTWPDKVALEFATCLEPGNYQSQKWTYKQLDEEANRVAQILYKRGTTPGEIISICFDKCAEASFAIIGIMKAGCGYVALDPNAPADRLKFIVEDSAAKLIITAGNPAQTLRTFVDGEMIDLTDPAVLAESTHEMPQLLRDITPQDISYCLYTSGTTGTPKGCLLTHENAIQAMLAFQRLFDGHWTTDSKWLQFASFHFDVSVLEQFWSWSVGICVASAPRDLIFEDIPSAIQQLGITHIDLTPSLARLLHPDDVPSLCKGVFITGGEQLKQEILDVWGEYACIYNGYGPTEATIGVTMYPRVPKNGKPSNIGPQFDNVGSFVLKPGTELPVLRGGIGELCVSGKLVGKGYLNRPELTTERFPTLSNFKERVYRTGDLVRILHDGTFIFLGRADDQVKLRGQRLELGEINEVIKKSRDDLEEVVTLVLKHKAQAKEQLVTFFVTSGKNESEGNGVVPLIRDACKSRLPGYMVPTHFISIKALPLNANNKADSNQLAAIFNDLSMEDLQKMSLSEQSHTTWTEKENEVVKNIARLFPVEVPQLTRSSNIFQLGIDSITMVTFSQSLRNCGYTSATNATVRSNPTIGSLVEALLDSKPDESKRNLYLAAAKQNIAGFSQQHAMAICKELGVSIEQIECIAPCTPVQEGMIYRFLESDSLLYFNRLQYGLKMGVCFHELAAAWDRVVSRLQILRTKFVSTNDGFAQVVLKSVESSHQRTSKGLNKSDMLKMPWSLEKSGLKFQEKLILNIFHGLYDGNSLGMILNHLSDEFHHAPNIQYGSDFHSSLAHGPLAIVPGAEAFWKSHLRTWSPYVLPHKYKDQGDFVYAGTLDLENFEDARKALSVAPQAIIQAAWIAALQLIISPNPTTIGIVMSGRTIDFEEVENVAGPLFNTVPFHLPIKPGTQISSLVAECHSINMKAQEFQHTSLKDIRKWVSAGMSGPLFDTIFAFQRPDVNEERFSNSLGRETGVIDEIVPDYPLALEATLSHSNTKLSFQIVGKSSAVPESMARILAAELTQTIKAILSGERKEIKVDSPAVPKQPELVPSSSSEPPIFSSPDQDVLSVLTKQQQNVVCSEIAILAKLDGINIHEPRSIFELGLDSIDVIKLSSRLRENGIEISVSGIIKCQTVIKILENAKVSKSKLHSSPSMEDLRKISKRLENYLKPSLPPNYERVFPATPLQEGILKEMVQSNFRRYFTVHIFQLSTWTQEEKLMRAVDHVIENSPILRTTFLEVHDPQSPANYAQIVNKDWEKATKSNVLAGHDSWSLEQILQGAEDRLRGAWASIDKHMFGIAPVHFGTKRFIMMAISHALYDGGSLPMIHDDIRKAYYGYELPKRPDYVCYIAEAFYSTSDEANEFWKATLWNSPPSVFPKQEPPPKHESVTHRHEEPSVFSLQEVKSFCSSSNITLQTLGQTCWAFVLAELMGQLDVVFGAVLACRDTTEADQVNFPLFNTVAVRSVIRGTLDQMLRDMQERSVTTRQFQHFPLRKAQAYALGCRNASTKDSTLFDTLFTYQGARPSEEVDPLYSSIGGSSGVELAICVEMEIEDKSDRLYWTAACKSDARNLQQTKDIIANLDMILGRILKDKQEQAIMIRPDGISLCGFRTFQPLGINSTQKPLRYTRLADWSEIELKLRESISVISGLPEENILGDSTIFQLGLDSITVLKLPALLKKHHIELTASEIMKYLTIREIANHLSEKQEPQQETVIDVDAILVESTSWITQAHFDRLQASSGRIEYTMPATAGQRYMIRRWQFSQGSLFYACFKFKLPYGYDPNLLDFAWFKLQCQHDILRTGFAVSDTESRIAQIVYKDPSNEIMYTTELPKPEERVRFWGIRDLEEPPLRLFVTIDGSESGTSNEGVELHLIMHHALYDGISISLLVNNFKAWCEDLYSMSKASSELSVSRASWRTFVATTIREENKQFVKDQWVDYLGSADGNGYYDSPWKVIPGDEDAIRTEVFIPGIKAKRLKSLARLQGVSVDHILIVMASKLFGIKRLKGDSDSQSPPKPKTDIIVGLYLANRFPFSQNLSKMLAPTLNLLPIKVNIDLPDEESVKGVQRDLGKIGEGGMANVGLDEIREWTGVRVNGWINIVKSVDGDQSVDRGKEVDGRANAETNGEDWEVVGKLDEKTKNGKTENGKENQNPGSEDGVRKEKEKDDEILRPIVDREGYMRSVEPRNNLKMKAMEDCGAYVSSIDLELRYHPDTEELDLGIFGPENMITLDEARHWHELLQHQV